MAAARSVAGWLAGFLLLPALGMIPPPKNVKMNSVNFKNILQWESPAFPKGNLTFTAQYESYWYFQDRCKNTASTHCDFSVLSKYGDHTVRVRAEFADEHSEWVNVTFCPVDDTIIGPPEMQIEPLADSLHMRFSAPKIENEPETWTMKNIYNSWAYRVQYWKNGTDEKIQVTSRYDSAVLRDLEAWTTYCIQVQGFLLDQNRNGEWSEPVCERTTNDETTPPWIVAILLVTSVFVVFLFLLGCFGLLWFICKKAKYTFHSGTSLPQHLKEFLGHPHRASLLFSLPVSDETEVFDELSIVHEEAEGKQDPRDSCALGTPCEPGPQELGSRDRAPSPTHGDPLHLTSASEV
ncbi:interleukin-10 receptor subunit beta isoform X2 [Phodopus roborovskii]|uniref:Interleukin-10 receptor subunit beta n=1 Tax=Phodopus roborovskii TaxID=109678 RepID=A0AAU9ZKH9_PHORO|nr:interleukin-10 receptor subunit beta isoform X2 [Phodopus roborovskii]CAH6792548.1 Il10rb [Phodopus roborovskii]